MMVRPPTPDPRPIPPLVRPPDTTVELPGSKSITNRALLAAALAAGRSRLDGALFADDTEAMVDCLTRLGATINGDPEAATMTVEGVAALLRPGPLDLDARQAGTTARFLLPVLAVGPGPYRLDGDPQLRARPMAPGVEAARALGAQVDEIGEPGHLPVVVTGGAAARSESPLVRVSGGVSSQFLSGLLLAGPLEPQGLEVALTSRLVSRPYIDMTTSVMREFGAAIEGADDRRFVVAPGGYRAATYRVEPDASAASYVFAAAAVSGGRVTVPGLTTASLQGDVRFVDLLAQMGAAVAWSGDGVTVTGPDRLRGIEADLSDLSDTAPTLAAVAVFADAPTRVTGIGFIRRKETDRVANVVRELRRCGVDAVEQDDGFLVRPGAPRAAVIEPDGDHRIAMALALLGLRASGIAVADPGCVAKTFPGYWKTLDQLRR
ncbi:MAG: 3-phosphoshikimate 1-carboxyvinyltransferase [Acidimicrobiales bacterium]